MIGRNRAKAEKSETGATARPEKREYVPPAIIHSEAVEALAGACDSGAGGKALGQPGCSVVRS